jgi:hypothetical protein
MFLIVQLMPIGLHLHHKSCLKNQRIFIYFLLSQKKRNKPVRNGMSSDRVLSTPSANAIVDNFLILFKRNYNEKNHHYEIKFKNKFT